ncbi:MAG: hypothetical protein FWE40_04815 [Oscillospiraceae bacterium]|nr:hypothetical protein [Oscillospiraceae bacterium]
MAQENFTLPNNPGYNRNIRRMITTDPVHANVVNDWLQPVIDNVHHNHLAIDASRTAIRANEAAIDANRTAIGTNELAIGANTTAINQTNTRIDSLEDAMQDKAGDLAADFTAGLDAVNERIEGIRQLPAGGSTNQVLFGGGMGWQSLSQSRDLTIVDEGENLNSVSTSFAWLDEPQYNWSRLAPDLPERFNEPITFAVMGGEFWAEALENEPAQIMFQGQQATLAVQASLAQDGESVHLIATKTQNSETTEFRFNQELESWQRYLGNDEWVGIEDEHEISITARSVSLANSELAQWNNVIAQQVVHQVGLHARTHEGWQPVGSGSGGPSTFSGGANARRLIEGVDFTADAGQTMDTVHYSGTTVQSNIQWFHGSGTLGFNASTTTIGQVAHRQGHFWAPGRNRFLAEELANMSDLQLVINNGQTLSLEVTDVENIYCVDNTTIRTSIVTAAGDFPGISFQLKAAIGYNLEDPSVPGYIDQISFMFTVTDFDPGVFSSTYSSGILNIIQINFSLPPISKTYAREFGAMLRLNDDFEIPEQLTAKLRIRYVHEPTRRPGTVTITCSTDPRAVEHFSSDVITDEFAWDADFDLSNVMDFKNHHIPTAYIEYAKVAYGRKVFLLFPNWNWAFRVMDVELLELWKKFEQPGR